MCALLGQMNAECSANCANCILIIPRTLNRLRELCHHLDHGEVPTNVLQKTLRYAACVLDTVSMDETRRLLDEEDDLSEVQPDAVPNEVREWLATTFTRNNTAQKRRAEDKPKFRSVANAIRAGIMVDRLYRRLCSSNMVQIPTNIANMLKSIDNWSFDVFGLGEVAPGQVLKYTSYELFNRYGILHKFKVPQSALDNFIFQIEQGYIKYKNPYHNNLHAADVTQSVHYFLCQLGLVVSFLSMFTQTDTNSQFNSQNWLSDLEIFATLLAAIIHDFQHTGTTNNFHVMSGSDTAILYNDRAVLENYHISTAFRVILEEDANILKNLSKEEYREFRALIIEMVLATDMSSHFQQIKTMKSLLAHSGELNVDKSKALSLVLHCCDISHPSKQWGIHRQWTELLMEEFFRQAINLLITVIFNSQGDKEKELGLPYSPLCDRNTTLIAESQIGFIDFIVAPSMEVCGDLIDKVHQQMQAATRRQNSTTSEDTLDENESKMRPKSLSSMKTAKGMFSLDATPAPLKQRQITSAPASPRYSRFTAFNENIKDGRLVRPWLACLDVNRSNWQARAVVDHKIREQKRLKDSIDEGKSCSSPESEL
ncbi:calcium/calmodulin-dependent 3':5'-cyclic nucleotide phosphodiesterase 1A-like isoform X2 [Leptotrombidium deliense]|uniref:Phosphodiesterase n=1 Tax=Leptotrombidium deliense TaxID=299467 RepID=A0A443SI41_9ACAR|nr:calcium/calmodulin-dependent 3':5'-cyclic nucleotide phosphodiesterase 1A-like isoform X2 [Leptotrombidium deliense]